MKRWRDRVGPYCAQGSHQPRTSRGADTRALTQVLFAAVDGPRAGHRRSTTGCAAALIEANLPLVRYAAARFRSRNEPMEDVIQVGTIGLINAIDRFDPDRGVQFPTFAMPTVVGEIKRYFRDNVRTVHVPRRLHELWVQVNGATEDLTTASGRTPTTAEIAERLRITEDEVLSCIEAGRLVPRHLAGGRPGGRRAARACSTGSATRTRRWPASSTATSSGISSSSFPSANSGSCCCATTAI